MHAALALLALAGLAAGMTPLELMTAVGDEQTRMFAARPKAHRVSFPVSSLP